MTKERHPNMEEIIWVLEHLNSTWKCNATIGYILQKYEELKKSQEGEQTQ